jgi:hypothetical protein
LSFSQRETPNVLKEDFCQDLARALDIRGSAALCLDGGHFHAGDSARGNVLKRGQRAVQDIQRQSMHGDPASDANSDRRDLSGVDPDSGKSFAASTLHAEFSAGQDDHVFQKAQVAMEVASTAFQIEDGIGDKLARPVPRGLPASIDFENGMRKRTGRAEAGLIPASANRINRFVFEKKKRLAAPAGETLAYQPILQVQRFLIPDPTEPLSADFCALWCHL